MQKKTVVFIVNPISGKGRHRNIEDIIARNLDSSRFSFRVAVTGYASHARELAREAVSSGADIVAAVGGDGTVNEVAGVVAVPAGRKDLPHVGIDVVDAGDARGEETAAGHDDVDVFEADAFFTECAQDLVRTHLVLVHDVRELRQFLDGMLEFLVENGFSVAVIGKFRRDGPGVYDQDISFGGFPVDGSDDAHDWFFVRHLQVRDYFPELQDSSGEICYE